MKHYYCEVILLSLILNPTVQFILDGGILAIYSDTSGEEEFDLIINGDEVFYVDFQKKEIISTIPAPADPLIKYDELFGPVYTYAIRQIDVFKKSIRNLKQGFNIPPPAQEAPLSAIYPRNEVELGSANTLICLVARFYPPHVTVTWTRNNKNVTSGVTLSRYYLTEDEYFKVTSTLKITAQEGDIYTCTVQHKALEEPLTREWEVEVSEPSVGPSVFCGVGVALGLLGVATGTFFFFKGTHGNQRSGVQQSLVLTGSY
ncbi:hypothetical protein ACEWY4_008495 [Coilia grayii]|uniref:Ig-like domain-containing protein n=1 Tax=Coilia grayii TaxID=363190 RepID=A0ABD1KB61_9TELE